MSLGPVSSNIHYSRCQPRSNLTIAISKIYNYTVNDRTNNVNNLSLTSTSINHQKVKKQQPELPNYPNVTKPPVNELTDRRRSELTPDLTMTKVSLKYIFAHERGTLSRSDNNSTHDQNATEVLSMTNNNNSASPTQPYSLLNDGDISKIYPVNATW